MNLMEWNALCARAFHRPLIRVNGKAPLDRDWPNGPFDDPDGWHKKVVSHKGNVGLPMGRGLGAIDADLYKPLAQGSLEALVDATKLDLATITGITGRGGRHYLFTYDPKLSVPSIPLEPLGFPGIELKADGGMIVVPPSIHPDNGQSYSWEEQYGPGDVEPLAFTREFLLLVGALKSRARKSPFHWHPLEEDASLDDLNVATARLLCEHFDGHDPVRVSGDVIGVWRPGKLTGSASATVGFIGPGVAKVWTDGWPPFEMGQVYDLGQLRSMAGLVPKIEITRLGFEFPPGYRLWRPGDEDRPPPELAPEAYHGRLGEYLHLVEEETEGHPAAIGAILLTQLGCLIGRRAQIWNGEHFHHANLFVLIVGGTSTGAKGVAATTARLFMDQIEPAFSVKHIIGGFGSGEALLDDIRDLDEKAIEKGEKPMEKRRVVVEPEFARILQVARREHNILSIIIRNCFDYEPLRHRTKTHGLIVATDHHVSVEGAITPAELLELSAEVDIRNGWLNRFLFFHSALARILPFGGAIDRGRLQDISAAVKDRVTTELDTLAINGVARTYRIMQPKDAKTETSKALAEIYDPWYRSVRRGTGPIPDLVGRQHVHVPRLMLILALLDGSDIVTVEHFQAARAWSDYSVATVERLFGGGIPGKAGQLLAAIRETGAEGLDGTRQVLMFKNTLDTEGVARLRTELEEQNLILTARFPTGGRPRLVSVAMSKEESK